MLYVQVKVISHNYRDLYSPYSSGMYMHQRIIKIMSLDATITVEPF